MVEDPSQPRSHLLCILVWNEEESGETGDTVPVGDMVVAKAHLLGVVVEKEERGETRRCHSKDGGRITMVTRLLYIMVREEEERKKGRIQGRRRHGREVSKDTLARSLAVGFGSPAADFVIWEQIH
ncbi:hypothetical protein E2562_023636 [Oryza meyeriana var. granulata]|uniref:Uncharacterized protein n=1 Tax=Oryza meyeriana var. granulata TaxID=110450 RepID=A0A6G1BPM4_9ORYZ|nr:hypothetical protein E2562_023636 [Oryza meyeriana var. granulata]